MIQNQNSSDSNKNISALELLQYFIFISVILYFGKTLFIPLSFSILISFILYPVCKWMQKKGISKSMSILISIFGVSLLFTILLYIFYTQVIAFSNEWNNLKPKLIQATDQISVYAYNSFGIKTDDLMSSISISDKELFNTLKNVFLSLSESLFLMIMIPLFSVLILFYRRLLVTALYSLFPKERKLMIHEVLLGTVNTYYNFIKGMLIVYLIVGLLNSIGLALLGVPHPFLFGFIASILTFIPYVGILVSSLLPIMISWLTHDSIWYPIGVIAVFSFVQVLEAYVIFPIAVGNRLKINALAIITMIIFGGIIWGVAGMILFIPFISIAKLIADKIEKLKTLSILLGE